MKLGISEFSKHRGMKDFVTYVGTGEFSKHLGMNILSPIIEGLKIKNIFS